MIDLGSGWYMGAELIVFVALALALRLGWWAARALVIENEGAEYARLAENLFGGNGYVGLFGGQHALFPPLYPLLIGLVAAGTGDVEAAGRLVSLVSGLALVPALYCLTRQLLGGLAARLAGLTGAMHPLLVALSVSVYSESLAIFLVVVGTSLAVSALSTQSTRRAAGAGTCFGLAYLVRPEALLFLIPVAGSLGLSGWFAFRQWRRAVRLGFTPLLCALLLGAPYAAYLTVQSHRFHWEGKTAINDVISARMREGMSFTEAVRGLDSATAENEGGHGPYLSSNQFAYLERAATGPGRLGEMLTAVPARAHGVAVGLWHASFTGAPVILVVAAAGLATFPWFRDVWLAGLLLFAIGALQIAFVLTLEFVWSRFYFPLLPLIIPWFAGGLARALELATRSAPGGAAGIVGRLAQIACLSILVGTVVFAYSPVAALGEFSQAQDQYIKEAGLRLRQEAAYQVRPGRVVLMGYGSALPFYARANLRYLPYAPEERALAYVHRQAPHYLAIRSNETHQAPYFAAWLARGIPDACAVPLFDLSGENGQFVRVWRWACNS